MGNIGLRSYCWMDWIEKNSRQMKIKELFRSTALQLAVAVVIGIVIGVVAVPKVFFSFADSNDEYNVGTVACHSFWPWYCLDSSTLPEFDAFISYSHQDKEVASL